jgi:hypothetical protein
MLCAYTFVSIYSLSSLTTHTRVQGFVQILRGLVRRVEDAWDLHPMQGAGNVAGQGSDLGAFLATALDTCGRSAPVVFIGTDCVTLTNEAIVIASKDAADGNCNAPFQLLLPFCHHSIFYAFVIYDTACTCTNHT